MQMLEPKYHNLFVSYFPIKFDIKVDEDYK